MPDGSEQIGVKLDLSESDMPGAGSAGRPWLQVWFACSGKYVRVYRAADGSGYTARCPQCSKPVRFKVGEGGTAQRFFTVSCR